MKKFRTSLFNTAITNVVLLVLSLTCLAQAAKSQNGLPSADTCSVQITSLTDGDLVGPSATIKGTATIPADGYLWILAKKKSMGKQWWPQAGGAVEIDDSHWEAEVVFGRPVDVGSTFEVAAVVVNRQTNEELVKWFATAKELDYPPIPFPNNTPACKVTTLKVVKSR